MRKPNHQPIIRIACVNETESAGNEMETTLQQRGSMALRLGPNLRAIVSLRNS